MKKGFNQLNLLWVSITSMIGSGWLFGALYSAHYAGPSAILAWPIAGCLLLIVAFCYAEVATLFPEATNLPRLPLYTHGQLTSLIMTWVTWLALSAIPAIETQGIIQYASNYFPQLMIHDGIHYTPSHVGYKIVIIILLSFVFLNYFGIQLFARVNGVFTIWKLIIPTITFLVLIKINPPIHFSTMASFMPYGWQGIMAAMSSGGVLFSLLGFRQMIIMAKEVENGERYIPLILISSLLLTTLLYTGLQWSFIKSIHPKDLMHGWNHLSFPGDAGPFASIAALSGVFWLSKLLYVDAFISPYATGLVYTTTASRILSSMGELGYAPKKLTIQNIYEVPWFSLFINFIFATALFFLLKNWQAMSSFLVAALMLSYAMGPICLICFRKQLPYLSRPFRLKWGGICSFLGFYICTAGIYWTGFQSVIKLLALTFIGLISYTIYYTFNPKKSQRLDILNAIWLFLYLIYLGLFSYFGNFGGINLIAPFWDLVLLLGFTFIIYLLAYISRKPAYYTQMFLGNHGCQKIM